jgi:hypothetical protein
MLNDKQLYQQEDKPTTPQARKLADKHVKESLDNLKKAILLLTQASRDIFEDGGIVHGATHERVRILEFREANYQLFFVCKKLFKHATESLVTECYTVLGNDCQDVIKGVHQLNKIV